MLADDKLFSTSSGRSTDPDFRPRVAYKSFRCVEGLDGANRKQSNLQFNSSDIEGNTYSAAGCCSKAACCALIVHRNRRGDRPQKC